MLKFTGVFAKFKDLEKIPTADITRWLKNKGEAHTLEDSIGNRILYPHVIPNDLFDLDLDFALLTEAVKRNPGLFLQKEGLVVTSEFFLRFPPLSRLVLAVVGGLTLTGLTKIFTKTDKLTFLGSVVSRSLLEGMDLSEKTIVNLLVNKKSYKVSLNNITILPIKEANIKIKIEGKELEVFGGNLGVVLDLRKNG